MFNKEKCLNLKETFTEDELQAISDFVTNFGPNNTEKKFTFQLNKDKNGISGKVDGFEAPILSINSDILDDSSKRINKTIFNKIVGQKKDSFTRFQYALSAFIVFLSKSKNRKQMKTENSQEKKLEELFNNNEAVKNILNTENSKDVFSKINDSILSEGEYDNFINCVIDGKDIKEDWKDKKITDETLFRQKANVCKFRRFWNCLDCCKLGRLSREVDFDNAVKSINNDENGVINTDDIVNAYKKQNSGGVIE